MELTMCDYSLHSVASRDGQVGDELISTRFDGTLTRGFAAIGQPNVAVCLLPGTEIAFEKDAEKEPSFIFFGKRKLRQKVARFRKINAGHDAKHHDALEFADGSVVLLTDLIEGQCATILQLPVSSPKPAKSNVCDYEASRVAI
jgi:hypothetical protein